MNSSRCRQLFTSSVKITNQSYGMNFSFIHLSWRSFLSLDRNCQNFEVFMILGRWETFSQSSALCKIYEASKPSASTSSSPSFDRKIFITVFCLKSIKQQSITLRKQDARPMNIKCSILMLKTVWNVNMNNGSQKTIHWRCWKKKKMFETNDIHEHHQSLIQNMSIKQIGSWTSSRILSMIFKCPSNQIFRTQKELS